MYYKKGYDYLRFACPVVEKQNIYSHHGSWIVMNPMVESVKKSPEKQTQDEVGESSLKPPTIHDWTRKTGLRG